MTDREPAEGADAATRLAAYAEALGDAIERALPQWVERRVADLLTDLRGAVSAAERAAAEEAGRAARDAVVPRVRALLATDVDQQRSNPLAIVRTAVPHPTRVLHEAGVPPVVRDAMAERFFPDDVYDLSPAAFRDLDESVHEPGLYWGAAKAHVLLARRRAEGHR